MSQVAMCTSQNLANGR